MATQDYSASVQGVSLRVTKLDANGNLMTGPMDSYTTSAFIRVSFTPEYEDGDEITEKAADGTVCVSYKAPDTLKRVNFEVAICNPDPELSNLMSGGLLLEKGGKSVGWASAQVGEDPSGDGVAIETWSRAVIKGKPAGTQPYFHWVFPFVKARLSGDRVIENGLLATTFEGFGLGNINFRSGIDGTWQWPAATDRPYLYARSDYAPAGMNGFYTWTPAPTGGVSATAGPSPAETVQLPVGTTGTNVPNSQAPYSYNAGQPKDAILSSSDYLPYAATAALVYPASADMENVQNPAPTAPAGLHDQPSVTYLARGFASTPGNASPGAKYSVNTVVPKSPDPSTYYYSTSQFTMTNAAGTLDEFGADVARQLSANGFKTTLATAWSPSQFITITVPVPSTATGASLSGKTTVDLKFTWNGTTWTYVK
jgi:hypothetical protein